MCRTVLVSEETRGAAASTHGDTLETPGWSGALTDASGHRTSESLRGCPTRHLCQSVPPTPPKHPLARPPPRGSSLTCQHPTPEMCLASQRPLRLQSQADCICETHARTPPLMSFSASKSPKPPVLQILPLKAPQATPPALISETQPRPSRHLPMSVSPP